VDPQLRPETVVIKLGERGCLVSAAQGDVRQPAFAVDAVDTTGCGDAFAAGFIHARLRDAPPDDCAALANAIGALVATRAGAAEALPSRAELQAFLAAHAPALNELV
jgi:ribokinase